MAEGQGFPRRERKCFEMIRMKEVNSSLLVRLHRSIKVTLKHSK